MAKAMLIMDMPKCCALCELYYSQVGLPKCTATWKTVDFKNTEVRQEWCPLREVPQKQNICGTYNSEYFKNGGKPASFKVGYNACIDEILGGAENG